MEVLYVEKQIRYEAFPKPGVQYRSINTSLRTVYLLFVTDFSSLIIIQVHTKVIYLQATLYHTDHRIIGFSKCNIQDQIDCSPA